MKPAILIVEDDATLGQRLALSLRKRGYAATAVTDGAAAREALDREPFGAAVVDLRLRGESGLEVSLALRNRQPALKVVVVTGFGSIATAKEALKQGAIDYLTKPVDARAIEVALGFAPPAPPLTGPAARTREEVPSLQRVEWEHLQRVLAEAGGNISEAARRLGLERRSLQRKLAKHPPP